MDVFFLTLNFTKILYNLHRIAIFGWPFMSVGMKRENMFDTLVLLVMVILYVYNFN